MKYVLLSLKWVVLAVLLGISGGGFGALLYQAFYFAEITRVSTPILIFLLPVGGVIIGAMYKVAMRPVVTNTHTVLANVHADEEPGRIETLLVGVSTFISQLLGASTGRDTAALQIGAGFGNVLTRLVKAPAQDARLIILCTSSAVFAGAFGAPVTGALLCFSFFKKDIRAYIGFVPCVLSAIAGAYTARLLNVPGFSIPMQTFAIQGGTFLKLLCLVPVCVLLCFAYRYTLSGMRKFFATKLQGTFIAGAVCGSAILLLTAIFRNYHYNGSGLYLLQSALMGNATPWDFAVKLVFTTLSLSCVFTGGEILPLLSIGAVAGSALAPYLGLNPGLAAMVCAPALLCGATKNPLVALCLAVELFGFGNSFYLLPVCALVAILCVCLTPKQKPTPQNQTNGARPA